MRACFLILFFLLSLTLHDPNALALKTPKPPLLPSISRPISQLPLLLTPDDQPFNLIYIKVPKCASSTSAGIARNIADRRGMSGTRSYWDFKGEPGVFSNHEKLHALTGTGLRLLNNSVFLFATLREPVSRAISHHFYRRFNHPEKTHPTLIEAFTKCGDYMTNYLSAPDFLSQHSPLFTLPPHHTPNQPSFPEADLIVAKFDAILIVEYFDEGLIVLKHRLGLSFYDILYLPSKVMGDNTISFRHTVSPSAPHPTFRELSATDQQFINTTFLTELAAVDVYLYQQALVRLHREILHIGQSFYQELAEFRQFKSTVTDRCHDQEARDSCLQQTARADFST